MRLSPRIAVTGALLALAAMRADAQQNPNADAPVAPFGNVFISLGNAFTNVNALNVRFDSTIRLLLMPTVMVWTATLVPKTSVPLVPL